MDFDHRARRLSPIAALLFVLSPAGAEAQYIGSTPSSSSGILADPQGPFAEQGLAANRGDVTVISGPLANPKFGAGDEAGLHITRNPGSGDIDGESSFHLQSGLAFGAAPGFELGVFTPAVTIKPDFSNGDLPVFVTWATRGAGLDVGLRSTLMIPTAVESFWRWNPGLHLLGRFEGGRMDVGAFFPMSFIDDENFQIAIDVPLRFSLDVSNDMYLGLETGIRKGDLSAESNLFIPAGFHALYSLGLAKHRMDIAARFFWDGFFWAGAPDGTSDRVLQNQYSISLGASFQFDVGDGRWPLE